MKRPAMPYWGRRPEPPKRASAKGALYKFGAELFVCVAVVLVAMIIGLAFRH